MPFSIIAQPDNYHPTYNPVVFGAFIEEYTLPGFRYTFKFYNASNNELFQTLRAAPNPDNGYGIVDVSKALQSYITYDLDFTATTPIEANNSHFEYYVDCGIEYIESWEFSGFTHVTTGPFAGDVKLSGELSPSIFSVGQTIKLIGNYYNNSFATIQDIDLINKYIIVNLPQLPGNPTDNGITINTQGELFIVEDLVTISSLLAYNEAVPFKDFPKWTESLVLPEGNGYTAEYANILTNSPNYLETQKEKDKYIIKKYQELYWNVFNNPINDPDTTLANSMICVNEFGDRWMLSDYSNWDDADIKMRQFNVSPDNPEWINITPNWGLNTFYSSGINPYTHINTDSSLSYSKWLEFWPTYAPGYDDCDAINLEIIQDPAIPGPPTTTFNFTFRPVVRGRNLRRIYHTLIDDKNAFLISEVEPGPTRVWNLYMQDSFNPYGTSNRYNAFAKRTSNIEPYGTCNASDNGADAWKAFDDNSLTYWETSDGLGTGTLTYNMPFDSAIGWARPINYTINKGTSTTNAPKNWTFQASEDGSTWVTLHTVTNSFGAGTYTSPDLNILTAYTRFRIVVTATVLGFNVRINEFTVRAQSRIARMASGNDCPTSGGFLFWVIQGGPIDEFSTLKLTTTAVLPTVYNGDTDEYSTYPTLKPRRVYLDYSCQDNETQILFLDRSGSWSSFAFPLKVNERIDNEKLDYRKNIGFVAGGQWTYNTYDSENTTYHSSVIKQYNITTNFMNKAMDDYFQELITSPVTYIKLKDSTDWVACRVLTKSLEPITRRLIQRTITIELSSHDNINI